MSMQTAADRERLRVLFLNQAVAFGGHEAMAVRAAAALSADPDKAVVFRVWAGNSRLIEAIERRNAAGARIVLETCVVHDVRLNALQSPLQWREIGSETDYFLQTRYAVRILVQGHVESGSVALLAARRARVAVASYVPMAHSLRSAGAQAAMLRDAVNRFYFAMPVAYVTISRGAEADLLAVTPSKPVLVVENWVEPAPPATGRASVPVVDSPDRRWVAIVGRVDFQQKGHDLLLAALTDRSAGCPAVGLLVVGDGPDLETLRRRVADAALQERVRFVPWISGSMERIYEAADAVILPSNYEGVPLVMLEALARRLPVAGSARDGMLEWLPTQALFDNRDPASIAAALRFVLSDRAASAFEGCFARATLATDETRFAANWRSAIATLSTLGERTAA